jgi:hypothetical protein
MIDLDSAFKRKPRRIPASVKALDALRLSSDSDGNTFQSRLNNPPTNRNTGTVFQFAEPTALEYMFGDPWMDNATMSKCEFHVWAIGYWN